MHFDYSLILKTIFQGLTGILKKLQNICFMWYTWDKLFLGQRVVKLFFSNVQTPQYKFLKAFLLKICHCFLKPDLFYFTVSCFRVPRCVWGIHFLIKVLWGTVINIHIVRYTFNKLSCSVSTLIFLILIPQI